MSNDSIIAVLKDKYDITSIKEVNRLTNDLEQLQPNELLLASINLVSGLCQLQGQINNLKSEKNVK